MSAEQDIMRAFAAKDQGARQYYRALTRRSFYFHTKAVMGYHFSVAGNNLLDADTFKPRQDWTQWVVTEAKRGLLEDPRAHVKSYGTTVALPPWLSLQRPCGEHPEFGELDHPSEVERANAFLLKHPHMKGVDSRFVIAADSVKRAQKWVSLTMSTYIANPLFIWLFPELPWPDVNIRPKNTSWSQSAFHLPGRLNPGLADPFLWAAGLESKEQGGRADGIFIEDIVGENSYKSPTELERRKDYGDTITNLLENSNYKDPRGGFVLIDGNRWSLDDFNSKVHDEWGHYEIWRRSAYRCFVHGTGTCGRWGSDEERQCAPTDEPLWKAQYPNKAALENVRQDKGESVFAAQWMNDPTQAADLDPNNIMGFLIQMENYTDVATGEKKRGPCIVAGDEIIPIAYLSSHVISIDPASSTEVKAARSAIVWEAMDRPTRRRFVLEIYADRWKPDVVLTKIVDLYEKVERETGHRARLICEKVAVQDFVGAGIHREAQLRKIQIPRVEGIPVPRNIKKIDKLKRRLGDLMGQRLLWIRNGLNLPRYEVRHFPTGTLDTLDGISQAEDIFQEMRSTINSEALARKRQRARDMRLAAAGPAGAPLP